MDGTKYSLHLGFNNSVGDSISMTFGNINGEVTDAQVRALAGGIVTNGAIFGDIPASTTSAELISTTTRSISL